MPKTTVITGNDFAKESLLWGVDTKTYSKTHKRFWNEWNVGVYFIHFACIASVMLFLYLVGVDTLDSDVVLTVTLDMTVLVLSSLMYISCVKVTSFEKTTVCFMFMLVTCSVYNYLDAVAWLVDGRADMRDVNLAVNTAILICPVVILCFFIRFVQSLSPGEDKYDGLFRRSTYILAAASVGTALGNLYTGDFFTVSRLGLYVKNDAKPLLVLILPCAMFIVCIASIIRTKLTASDKLILILYPLLPFSGAFVSALIPETYLVTALTFLSIFIMYINLFIRRDKELEMNRRALAESELKSVFQQITPHFIYNTLGTVGSLCTVDPEKAREMIFTFSDYLRSNLGDIMKDPLIPFERELERIRLYIAIEKERFPYIDFVFDIQSTDFMLPAMSVQPLVENAITHGIMGKETAGLLKISSFEDENSYFVVIEDDGAGFDSFPTDDGKNHIGIANVATRLMMLCGGDLTVKSTVGEGTASTITIRKAE